MLSLSYVLTILVTHSVALNTQSQQLHTASANLYQQPNHELHMLASCLAAPASHS